MKVLVTGSSSRLARALLPLLTAEPGIARVTGVDLGLAETFGLAVVGNPAEVRARIGRYAEAGVTHLLCAFGAGAVEPAITRESLELFAREVMPAFEQAPGFRNQDSARPLI